MDRRIKFRHIEALTAIARQGSLKAACQELHLSQPALSKTLKELEDILGAVLMTRDRGGVRMTPEGEVFLEFASQSLAALRRGFDGVAALKQGGAEVLRVGSLPSVAARLMPQAVARFRQLSPDTRLHLRDGAHGALTSDLRAGGLDMVIGRMGTASMMTGLSFTQLYQERVVCVTTPDHPLAGQTLAPGDLSDWAVLYPPEGAAIRPLLDRWCVAQGLGPFRDQIECVSGAFGRNYLRHAQALWFISEGVVAQDLADGRLLTLPLDLGLTAGPVGLMTRPDTAPSRSQQLFTRALTEISAQLPES
ncbi:pca operon transcription factor PcaQ [Tropicibacter naphthalenivorans]|uniref:Hca operon transcriptional activator n=1 Tax=Tropicibacter naphthalenivorans TaxID=441103 RepID=A0A0P1GCB6_9RHOB|nr:pca operon transcription factor PcaQ [Tropicibacter naphthalenivorans]CUH79005.1 Hca operon transcriptional activator [Tropicibacter naphthalenivorans]SMD03954.1 LysR family transcriptional regulator, pca operon transcriptional activator [Tropicibacter naphthalenivorans]